MLFNIFTQSLKIFKKNAIIKHRIFNPLLIRQNKGVIIIEYVLLLVVCLGIALLITNLTTINSDSQDLNDQGSVIKGWINILKIIAEDN